MRIALIDPSLFTWPYDFALADGLEAVGQEVAIFGKALGGPTDPAGDRTVPFRVEDGLRSRISLATLRPDRAARGPRQSGALRAWGCDVAHFQWTPLPVVDRWFLPALRNLMPIVLTVHDSAPFNDAPGSSIQRLGASVIGVSYTRWRDFT